MCDCKSAQSEIQASFYNNNNNNNFIDPYTWQKLN